MGLRVAERLPGRLVARAVDDLLGPCALVADGRACGVVGRGGLLQAQDDRAPLRLADRAHAVAGDPEWIAAVAVRGVADPLGVGEAHAVGARVTVGVAHRRGDDARRAQVGGLGRRREGGPRGGCDRGGEGQRPDGRHGAVHAPRRDGRDVMSVGHAEQRRAQALPRRWPSVAGGCSGPGLSLRPGRRSWSQRAMVAAASSVMSGKETLPGACGPALDSGRRP